MFVYFLLNVYLSRYSVSYFVFSASYLYVSFSRLITSVGEERTMFVKRANSSAVVYLL